MADAQNIPAGAPCLCRHSTRRRTHPCTAAVHRCMCTHVLVGPDGCVAPAGTHTCACRDPWCTPARCRANNADHNCTCLRLGVDVCRAENAHACACTGALGVWCRADRHRCFCGVDCGGGPACPGPVVKHRCLCVYPHRTPALCRANDADHPCVCRAFGIAACRAVGKCICVCTAVRDAECRARWHKCICDVGDSRACTGDVAWHRCSCARDALHCRRGDDARHVCVCPRAGCRFVPRAAGLSYNSYSYRDRRHRCTCTAPGEAGPADAPPCLAVPHRCMCNEGPVAACPSPLVHDCACVTHEPIACRAVEVPEESYSGNHACVCRKGLEFVTCRAYDWMHACICAQGFVAWCRKPSGHTCTCASDVARCRARYGHPCTCAVNRHACRVPQKHDPTARA